MGGYYIHKWKKSPVQLIQEHNQVSAYRSLFHTVNEFDTAFKFFFQSFHAYFGSILELERRFLPLSSKIIITHPHSNKPEERKIFTFDEFKIDTFDHMFKIMKDRVEELRDVIQITNGLVSITLTNILVRYTTATLEYMNFFEQGGHTTWTLDNRYMWANAILDEIKKNDIIKQFSGSEIEIFVKKWNDYIDSELILKTK